MPWIESTDAILRERYGWYAEHGLDYAPEVLAWLRDALGPDTPIDVHLRAGERIRLGPGSRSRCCTCPVTRQATSASGTPPRAARS